MPFWSKYTDPPTSMICGFKKEHMLNRLLFQRVRKSEHVHFSGLMGGSSSSPITIIAHHHRHDYDDVEVEMH